MWFDSFSPLAGSRSRRHPETRRDRDQSPSSSDQRQFARGGRRRGVMTQDPDGLAERVRDVAPGEDASSGLRRVRVGQVGVHDGVGRAEGDRRDQVEEDEQPDVGGRGPSGARAAAKMSSVMAVTILRLPRSPAIATGSPHAIWATAATKATAPSPARLRWNECWMLGPSTAMPVADHAGHERGRGHQRAAGRTRTSGGCRAAAVACPPRCPGITSMSATASWSRCAATASFSSSSGTVNSKSAPSATRGHYPWARGPLTPRDR